MDLDEEDVYDLSVLSQLVLEQLVSSQTLNRTEQHQQNNRSHSRDDLINSEAELLEEFEVENASREEANFRGAGEIVIIYFITWDKYCRCD